MTDRTRNGSFRFAAGAHVAALACMAGLALASAPAQATATSPGNNTPGFVKKAVDLGPADPTAYIAVTVWLQLHNEQRLDQLVQQQNQKGSANFHKWITQGQFNSMFGPTSQELKSVQNYLAAKNLTVLAVAENNMYVKVEGTVAQVQKAFGVQIHNYKFGGQLHRSNTADPSINDPAGAHVAAVSGLDDLGFQPLIRHANADGAAAAPVPLANLSNGLFFESQCFRGVETRTFTAGTTSATYTGNRYGADISNSTLGHLPPCGYQPSEMQTAYNMNSAYAAGLDGSGETIVVVDAYGSPTIQTDAEVFSQLYGLPDLTADNFQVLRAPGAVHHPPSGPLSGAADWLAEVSLDVEWAHAMAPGARIVLVVGPNNSSDLDEAINYAVVHHLGNTISNSWSSVEGLGNPAQFNRINRILQMAAAQGMDVNFSSGDDGDYTTTLGFKTVSFPGSSPFATSVGGTSVALQPDNTIALQTGWGNNETRIADVASLGNPPVNPPLALGFVFGAGGGASLTYAKPAFQASLPGAMRLVPDVAMPADPYTGAEIILTVNGQLSVDVIGGTSLACPMFSGIMAIAAQKNGHVGLGQAASLVYNLPAGAVTDVTSAGSGSNVTGSITTPALTTTYSADQLAAPLGTAAPYYSTLYDSPYSTRWYVLTFGTDTSLSAGPGWDDVTGVGTPNGVDFVNALVP